MQEDESGDLGLRVEVVTTKASGENARSRERCLQASFFATGELKIRLLHAYSRWAATPHRRTVRPSWISAAQGKGVALQMRLAVLLANKENPLRGFRQKRLARRRKTGSRRQKKYERTPAAAASPDVAAEIDQWI
ncbi:MAG: hypothetical protein ACREYA_30390 [Cupriavidus necator]